MTNLNNHYTLINPQNGHLAFKILPFEDNSHFDYTQRNNYYSLIWIQEGNAILTADFTQYEVGKNDLFAFSPYQPFMLQTDKILKGIALFFHPDFFCIHKHQQEVACNGVLFNNIYQPPMMKVDLATASQFETLLEQMKNEILNPALAQYELLISYLKIILINASRLKNEQNDLGATSITKREPFILQTLKDSIEANYKTRHSASEYAELLNITPKALAKITKTHLNKTLSSLISERIIIEAKRELYLTNKTVKQIAYELGYEDEYYFSRFFKTNADVSPQIYRETVGFNRMQMN